MKLCGCKRSLPRSVPGRTHPKAGAALSTRSAMTGGWIGALAAGASLPWFTAGTVGTGPKAWDEVFASALAPGVLAPDPRGIRLTCTASNASVAVSLSLPSRSADAPTRLETRAKESNMYTSRWVD